MISAVLSLLAIHHVTSFYCDFSMRPQSEVLANWSEDIPEEWTTGWDCQVRVVFTTHYFYDE